MWPAEALNTDMIGEPAAAAGVTNIITVSIVVDLMS